MCAQRCEVPEGPAGRAAPSTFECVGDDATGAEPGELRVLGDGALSYRSRAEQDAGTGSKAQNPRVRLSGCLQELAAVQANLQRRLRRCSEVEPCSQAGGEENAVGARSKNGEAGCVLHLGLSENAIESIPLPTSALDSGAKESHLAAGLELHKVRLAIRRWQTVSLRSNAGWEAPAGLEIGDGRASEQVQYVDQLAADLTDLRVPPPTSSTTTSGDPPQSSCTGLLQLPLSRHNCRSVPRRPSSGVVDPELARIARILHGSSTTSSDTEDDETSAVPQDLRGHTLVSAH